MINFNNENTQQIFESNPQYINQMNQLIDKYGEYKNSLNRQNLGFLGLPFDRENLQDVKRFVETTGSRYENIVLLGIGGSSLGPKCLRDCFYNYKIDKSKRFIILDNIDPDYLSSWSRDIDLEKTLFLVISKSGRTPETMSQYLFFKEKTVSANLDPKNHFVFITDPESGYLREVSQREQITAFDIPSNVGGRFSVLSNVGLVIAEFMGIDTEKLLIGASEIADEFKDSQAGTNDKAFLLAATQYTLAKLGHNINVIMPYTSRLKTFGDWYVQLLSESIGKKIDRNGQVVNTGITPHPAIGVTDQHSQMQLFKEGPFDKLLIFLEVENFESNISIPQVDDEQNSYLSGVSFGKLLAAELAGSKQSLTESGKANCSLTIDGISEKNIGGLFMIFEIATAYLGEFYDIDAFNQPGVERSKTLTKEILS